MSDNKRDALPPPDPILGGLEPTETPTHQEAIPVPYVAGEQPRAPIWLHPPYNVRAVESPIERPSKK